MMEAIVGFVIGFLADLVRSVFMPATTEWLNRFLPAVRRKSNVAENILTLDVMEKLKALGKDPNLATHARGDASQFLAVLVSQREAFVDNAIEIIDTTYMSQTKMNLESARRAEVARQQMERALLSLERSRWLQENQLTELRSTQSLWEAYAVSQAKFAAGEFEGGSMAPLVYASELETARVSRTGELKRMLDVMRERYSDSL